MNSDAVLKKLLDAVEDLASDVDELSLRILEIHQVVVGGANGHTELPPELLAAMTAPSPAIARPDRSKRSRLQKPRPARPGKDTRGSRRSGTGIAEPKKKPALGRLKRFPST